MNLCAELATRDEVEVMLVTMSPENSYSFLQLNFPHKMVNSRIVPSISKKNIIDTKEFEAIVNEFKPDIIHSHLFRSEMLAHEKYFPNVKYVTHCQDNMTELYNFKFSDIFKKRAHTQQFEKRWMIKRYRRTKNNFIVISRDSEEFYNKALPRDLRKIHLLHHAIDFERFHKANVERIPTLDPIRLVYTARFAIYKNHTFLVDVIEKLKIRGYNVSLDLLGGGEEFETVKEKIIKKDLMNEIHLHGFVDNVEEYLKKAHVYVHPAYYEPFGLVFLEAMAAGLPVVCLDGRGNRDIIEQGKNGFMIFEQDPDLFADKIIEVLQSKELYKNMADYGIKYARSYDLKNHVDKLLTYYKTLLNS